MYGNLVCLLTPRSFINVMPCLYLLMIRLSFLSLGDRTEDQGRPTERPTSPRSSTAVLSTSTVPVPGHTPSPNVLLPPPSSSPLLQYILSFCSQPLSLIYSSKPYAMCMRPSCHIVASRLVIKLLFLYSFIPVLMKHRESPIA